MAWTNPKNAKGPSIKDASIGIGATPAKLPAVDHIRPTKMESATPRDSGGMADGSSGGNFDMSTMLKVGLNCGENATGAGEDAAKDATSEYGK
jgi:hypothetical protein